MAFDSITSLAPLLHYLTGKPHTMGNLCSSLKKPSAADDDPFARPGRVLGSTPQKPAEPRASIPKTTQSGQKLGGSPLPASASTAGGGGGEGDARTAAAKAAEVR